MFRTWWEGVKRGHRKRRRNIDLQILWPELKRQAAVHGHSVEKARLAFLVHIARDEAWTTDYTDRDLGKFVQDLR